MSALKKEIKRILTGIIVDNGEYISAAPNVFGMNFKGTFSGASSVGFAGVSHKKKRYALAVDDEEAIALCCASLITLGREVVLMNAPDAYAVIRIPVVRNPSIIMIEVNEGELVLDVYTARTLFAFFTKRSDIRRFIKGIPEGVIISEKKNSKEKAKKPEENQENGEDTEKDEKQD